jgi:DNA-binding NtrC family response regulator
MRQPKVLLVDDEVEYLQALARVLDRRGILVRTATDGASAVEMAREDEFDVIVLDLRMPGMDGLAALEAIRRRDPLTPVILLSGHADLERITTALKGGAADFLVKPCAVETLVSAIEDAAERKAIEREVAERAAETRPDRRRR